MLFICDQKEVENKRLCACEFRYFMVAVKVCRIFPLRPTILCNLRFSSIFKRKTYLDDQAYYKPV